MIIEVSSSIVGILIIFGMIARKRIVWWRGSKRTSEKEVELSFVNSAAGPKHELRKEIVGATLMGKGLEKTA